jgi:DNA polymerase-3 subunit alpha
LTKRIDLRAANKKALENLILAVVLIPFRERCGLNIFMMRVMELPFEKAIRYAQSFKKMKTRRRYLFGESSDVQIAEPVIPPCEDWSTMENWPKRKR